MKTTNKIKAFLLAVRSVVQRRVTPPEHRVTGPPTSAFVFPTRGGTMVRLRDADGYVTQDLVIPHSAPLRCR